MKLVSCFVLAVEASLWRLETFMSTSELAASRMLQVPVPRKEPCDKIASGLGNGTCFTLGTDRKDDSNLSLIRASYLFTGSFESAKQSMLDDFDSFDIVMKEDPNCERITLSPEDLAGPQIGKGSLTITEELAKESETTWSTSASVTYSTPGSFIAGVDFTLSAEYHKSLVKSTSNAIGQKFEISPDTMCTPTILRHGVKCDLVQTAFVYHRSYQPTRRLQITLDLGNGTILLPLSSTKPIFFASMMGCIDYTIKEEIHWF